MPSFKSSYGQTNWVERVVAALCYFSFGLVGLLYILITGRSRQSDFFQFNFLQSILLGVFAFLLQMTVQALSGLLGGTIGFFSPEAAHGVMMPIALLVQVGTGIIYLSLLFGAVWALLGKQAQLPLISRLVRQQIR
jgi:uncharacterized membrane protein